MRGDVHAQAGRLIQPLDEAGQKAGRDVLHDQQRRGEVFRQAGENRLQHRRPAGRGADADDGWERERPMSPRRRESLIGAGRRDSR